MIFGSVLSRIIYFQAFVVVVPVLICILRFRYMKSKLLFLSIYLGVSLLSIFISSILINQFGNNMPLFHGFTLVEFVLISLVYYHSFGSKLSKRIIMSITIVVGSFIVLNSVFIQEIYGFNTNARALEDVVFIIYPLGFFYSTLKELRIIKLEKEPMFWINIGILLYFSCNLFIFIFSNYIIESLSHENNLWIWFVHGVFNVLMYILFSIGLWHSRKKNAY